MCCFGRPRDLLEGILFGFLGTLTCPRDDSANQLVIDRLSISRVVRESAKVVSRIVDCAIISDPNCTFCVTFKERQDSCLNSRQIFLQVPTL